VFAFQRIEVSPTVLQRSRGATCLTSNDPKVSLVGTNEVVGAFPDAPMFVKRPSLLKPRPILLGKLPIVIDASL